MYFGKRVVNEKLHVLSIGKVNHLILRNGTIGGTISSLEVYHQWLFCLRLSVKDGMMWIGKGGVHRMLSHAAGEEFFLHILHFVLIQLVGEG